MLTSVPIAFHNPPVTPEEMSTHQGFHCSVRKVSFWPGWQLFCSQGLSLWDSLSTAPKDHGTRFHYVPGGQRAQRALSPDLALPSVVQALLQSPKPATAFDCS